MLRLPPSPSGTSPQSGLRPRCSLSVARCDFHESFIDTLPARELFDAATCLLVSQFILQAEARSEFFNQMARRLRPQGILIHAEIAFDTASPVFEKLFEVWVREMTGGAATS